MASNSLRRRKCLRQGSGRDEEAAMPVLHCGRSGTLGRNLVQTACGAKKLAAAYRVTFNLTKPFSSDVPHPVPQASPVAPAVAGTGDGFKSRCRSFFSISKPPRPFRKLLTFAV